MRKFAARLALTLALAASLSTIAAHGGTVDQRSTATLTATAPPTTAPNPFDRVIGLAQTGDSMPDTTFVDQDGRRTTFADLRGATVVVAFVYTRCKDQCPVITQKFGQARRQLGGAAFRFVEITIDPAHDDPRAMRGWARAHGIEAPGWLALTGDPAALDDFERRMGVSAIATGKSDIIHNDRLLIVGPDGKVADTIDGSSWTASDIAAQMRHDAGESSNWLERFDLALGKAAAFCGGAISGRAGIADLLASIAIFAAGIGGFVWLIRRAFAAHS